MDARKEKALAAILTSTTRAEAAKKAGVTVRTLHSYFQDPEFIKRYTAAFNDVVTDATRTAQRMIDPAFTVLQQITLDENENAQTRVTAARALLDFALRFTDHVDVIPRLEHLEETAERLKKDGRN